MVCKGLAIAVLTMVGVSGAANLDSLVIGKESHQDKSSCLYRYNSNGLLRAKECSDSASKASSTIGYSYDQNGLLAVEKGVYPSGGTIYTSTYSHAQNGTLISKATVETLYDIHKITAYTYGQGGILFSEVTKYSAGTVVDSTVMLYSQNLLASKEIYDKRGTQIGEHVYKYDSSNRVIQILVYEGSPGLLLSDVLDFTYSPLKQVIDPSSTVLGHRDVNEMKKAGSVSINGRTSIEIEPATILLPVGRGK